jgi:hypothetical protein
MILTTSEIESLNQSNPVFHAIRTTFGKSEVDFGFLNTPVWYCLLTGYGNHIREYPAIDGYRRFKDERLSGTPLSFEGLSYSEGYEYVFSPEMSLRHQITGIGLCTDSNKDVSPFCYVEFNQGIPNFQYLNIPTNFMLFKNYTFAFSTRETGGLIKNTNLGRALYYYWYKQFPRGIIDTDVAGSLSMPPQLKLTISYEESATLAYQLLEDVILENSKDIWEEFVEIVDVNTATDFQLSRSTHVFHNYYLHMKYTLLPAFTASVIYREAGLGPTTDTMEIVLTDTRTGIFGPSDSTLFLYNSFPRPFAAPIIGTTEVSFASRSISFSIYIPVLKPNFSG